jgi:hypothetical protein
MHWESVDPEWWVPQGYTVIRIDGRGTGKSPGTAHNLTMREAEDYYDAIEWAAVTQGERLGEDRNPHDYCE